MKNVFLFLLLFTGYSAVAQILTFDFAGIAGSEISATSNSNSSDLNISQISRGAGLSPNGNADRFNSNQWSEASFPDVTKYLEFSITPLTDKKFTVTELVIKHQRSSTGPLNFVVRISDDFSQDIASFNAADNTNIQTTSINLSTVTALQNRSGAVTFRVYGYSASGTSGAWGPGEASGNDIVINGATGTLPVSLNSFSGKVLNNDVYLNWTTVSESNSSFFEIFKSEDGKAFHPIGKVHASVNSVSPRSYSFTDDSGVGKEQYYQLNQVDLDGAIYKSKIIQLQSRTHSGLSVNSIANDHIQIDVSSVKSENGRLVVMDMAGKKYYDGFHYLKKGLNGITIPIEQNGLVLIAVLERGGRSLIQKFYK